MIPNPVPLGNPAPRNDPLMSQGAAIDAGPTIIDLLFTLVHYKRTVIACTVIGLVGGIAAVTALPDRYAYTTAIELGAVEQGAPPIESPEMVIAKMTNVFLPSIEHAHGQSVGKDSFTLGLDIKNPKGTKLVVLTSKGTLAKQAEHLALHQQIADCVLVEHRREFQLTRTNLGLELDQARRNAAAVKDQVATLLLRRSLLQEKRTLTNQRLLEIDAELARISSNREAAGRSLNGQEQVLTLMMLDLELTRERDKRDDMQRQVTLGLAEETDRLVRDEADLQRAQQEYEGRITAIQARIAHVADTRIVGEPQRSLKTVDLGDSVIVVISAFSGLIMGAMFAFFRQALSSRKQSASMANTSV